MRGLAGRIGRDFCNGAIREDNRVRGSETERSKDVNRPWRGAILLVALGGLASLTGCSHSCVPAGWYGARSVPAPRQPPGAPAIQHDSTYDIPGGAPPGKPTRAQACLVYPPATLTPNAGSSGQAKVQK